MPHYTKVTYILIFSFILFLNSAAFANANNTCNSAQLSKLNVQINLINSELQSSRQLQKIYFENYKKAQNDKLLSSSLAVVSGAVMAYGNFLFTRSILSKSAHVVSHTKVLAAPIKLQIWAASQIKNILIKPLSALGVPGLKAIAGVVSLAAIGADKGYAIAKGTVNIITDDGEVELKLNDIVKSEEAYKQAIQQVRDFRYQYLLEVPSAIEDGLSFGQKESEFRKNLVTLVTYEVNLLTDLYSMMNARYIIEKSNCNLR